MVPACVMAIHYRVHSFEKQGKNRFINQLLPIRPALKILVHGRLPKRKQKRKAAFAAFRGFVFGTESGAGSDRNDGAVKGEAERKALSSSGKINRKALPGPDLSSIASETEFVAPKTHREKTLCGIMEKVLNTSPAGIRDDFFDLGGDSLKAIEFVSDAHNEGIYLNVQTVFDCPTVQEMCRWLEKEDKPMVSFRDADFSRINRSLPGIPSRTYTNRIKRRSAIFC